jgi:YegS/Rv2252/BmrU family lipid kinase
MLDSYCFIINPNSGARRDASTLADAVRTAFASCARLKIEFTQRQGHAAELAKTAVSEKFAAVVVAGGDGTLNEVLPAFCGTETALGLIAKGSGNGFAREFGLPLRPKAAVTALVDYLPRKIDLGKVNGEYFANVAGIGLDAMIGRAFNVFGKKGPRGKLPYYYLGLKELLAYKPPQVELRCAGRTLKAAPMCLAFANGRQFGGGAIIAPSAKPDDGMLHVVLVENMSAYRTALNLTALFSGKIDKVSGVTTLLAEQAEVVSGDELVYHLDGEPRVSKTGLKVEIIRHAISFLAPPHKN